MQALAPKEFLKAISVFFYAMIGGMMMFTIIVFALNSLQQPLLTDPSITRVLFIAVIIVAAGLVSIAIRLYNKRMTDIRSTQSSLADKLDSYRSALILYLALCEAGGLFAVIVYFLTANKLLLIVIAAVLFAMLQKRPEKFKIFNELELSVQEQSELN